MREARRRRPSRALGLPAEDRQQLIARFLDWHGAQTAKLTQAKSIIGVQRGVTLVQGFRTRLIADVVTGKLDVRAAA